MLKHTHIRTHTYILKPRGNLINKINLTQGNIRVVVVIVLVAVVVVVVEKETVVKAIMKTFLVS